MNFSNFTLANEKMFPLSECVALSDSYISQIFKMRVIIIILMFGFVILYYKDSIKKYLDF